MAATTTMKASVIKAQGKDFQKIFEFSESQPSIANSKLGDSEIMVEMQYAGVCPADFKFAEGNVIFMRISKFPRVLGKEGSGVVVRCGKKVNRFKAGDAVFGYVDGLKTGTFAQYCVFQESELAKVPSGMTMEQAAVIPMGILTAYQGLIQHPALEKFKKTASGEQAASSSSSSSSATTTTTTTGKSEGSSVSHGIDSVIIQGASGGVGSFSVLLAKHYYGIKKVITTCSTKNIDYVKSLGATNPIDYTKQDMAKELLTAATESKADLCLDTVCEDDVATASMNALKPGGQSGTYVAVALAEDAEQSTFNLASRMCKSIWKTMTSSAFGGPKFSMLMAYSNGEQLQWLSQWMVDNNLHGLIPIKSYELNELPQAMEQVRSHRTVGKVVVRIPPVKQ